MAAACFRARLAHEPARTGNAPPGSSPATGGPPQTAAAGETRGFGAADLAAVLATCHRPRRRGRGVESDQVALERGRLDAVIAGLLFMAWMRRSEVSALRWADVADAADGDGVLVTVRRGKTNQEGEVRDMRFVKGGVARALRTLRAAADPAPDDQVVPLSPQMVGLRFAAAARAAGVEARVTAHSGRVGLASELTSRGASTTDVMLAGTGRRAGWWRTTRPVRPPNAGLWRGTSDPTSRRLTPVFPFMGTDRRFSPMSGFSRKLVEVTLVVVAAAIFGPVAVDACEFGAEVPQAIQEATCSITIRARWQCFAR